MVDKVRLSVDRETQEVLLAVTDGLTSLLTEQPAWAGELRREVLERLDSVRTTKLSWTKDLRAAVIAATRAGMGGMLEALADLKTSVADLDQKVQENRETLKSAEARLSLSLRRIEASLTAYQNAPATTEEVPEKVKAARPRKARRKKADSQQHKK